MPVARLGGGLQDVWFYFAIKTAVNLFAAQGIEGIQQITRIKGDAAVAGNFSVGGRGVFTQLRGYRTNTQLFTLDCYSDAAGTLAGEQTGNPGNAHEIGAF